MANEKKHINISDKTHDNTDACADLRTKGLSFADLARAALEARRRAYAPYSGFAVGAAVQDRDGRIFTGCNVENASYGLSNCAERTAIFNGVSQGARHPVAVAIAGGALARGEAEGSEGPPADFCPPCGACRQVLYEFGGRGLLVVLAKSPEEYKVYTLEELLPLGFGPESL